MKLDSLYYTPQQLASFYSIKKDTLLYYDKIGLFSPSFRNENGYRYYSASQINELDAILTLRDLGIPLSAIKSVRGDLSTPSFLSLLEKEKESISERIQECRERLRIIERVRRDVEEARSAEKYRLFVSHFRKERIIKVPVKNRSEDNTDDEVWQDAYRRLMKKADNSKIISVGSIVRFEEARLFHGAICREIYAIYDEETDGFIPEGDYANMYFSGSLDNLSSFYEAFLSALESASLSPMSDIYEELSISSAVTQNEEEHVTRLLVRIG